MSTDAFNVYERILLMVVLDIEGLMDELCETERSGMEHAERILDSNFYIFRNFF